MEERLINLVPVPQKSSSPNWFRMPFYVVAESDAAIHLDNRATGVFHSSITLNKMPDGVYESPAGSRYLIEEENVDQP